MERLKVIGEKCILFRRPKSYWQQAVSKEERIRNIVKVLVIEIITAWLFFQSAWALMFIWPMGIVLYKFFEEESVRKEKNVFLVQFKEMTEVLATGLRVGYSIENAIREAEKELKILYPQKNAMGEELEIVVRQIRLQISVEQALEDFAGRVELEDVQSFVSVFVVAKKGGGDMIGIMRNTVNQIGDKIDVKREIDTMLAAKRYEFRVMCVIPYVMIAYMKFSFPEFMSSLYGNGVGIGVMSVCLGIYVGACLIGAKLIEIEV